MSTAKRTHYATAITETDIGSKVCVAGWVQKQRDLGSLIFIDLRDRSGIIQLAFDTATAKDVFDLAFTLRSEYVIKACGTVRSRGSDANTAKKTGAIEIAVESLELINKAETPPFEITDDTNVNEELRLKHRYLDLRRPVLNENILFRHQVQRITREFFYENGFIDIETPNLVKQTPEGARDYVVPSRVHQGKFYALPQSPQLYKQLLMIAGFDRYFQIAHCFRDEDLRADRQPEFTQIDIEMSFADEEDVYDINERYIRRLFKETLGYDVPNPFPRMKYIDAMNRYGSDKPDLRFGFELVDLSAIVSSCTFKVFRDTLDNGGSVRAINFNGLADKISRKELDSLTEFVKGYKAKGMAWYKCTAPDTSSYSKFMTEEENKKILEAMNAKTGDVICIVADKNKIVYDALGALRIEVAKRNGFIKKGDFKFTWITEFPLFEYDEEDGKYYATHHPFTMPNPDDMQYFDTEPEKVRARMYDMVINGFEVGGGSIRIDNPELQKRVLAKLGYTEEMANERFGFLLEAYKYGAPNHGGLAFGLDRIVTVLKGLTSIRDVIAFPKVQNASELMSGAPGDVEQKIMNELGIVIKPQA